MTTKEAKEYFYNQHDVVCNQKYNDTLPYSFHLDMVEKQGLKFKHLLKSEDYYITFVAIYGHDSIEDARLTYNNIKTRFGEKIADIIILCTEFPRGKTRDERKPIWFYEELKTNQIAVFVKLCDVIANVKFSLLTNSSMFNTYKSEYYDKVKPYLYSKEFKPMFDYLERLFNVEID